jgi:transcriptional regulator with XRE-family HTH domain
LVLARNRSELAQFLRSRRERITPAQVGLPAGPRRRTPGLRREEIAVLAGLSPTWYTYLEQGRDIRPSPEVLDSLAGVLQLNSDERRYLHLLATGQAPPLLAPGPDNPECPGAQPAALMEEVMAAIGRGDYPVYAGNLYGDVIAWNDVAASWYTDFARLPDGRRNMLWWLLTAPEARERIVHWEEDTRDVLARFRIASATRPWDQRFQDLIATISRASPEFRSWWPEHDVRDQHVRLREIRLPNGETRRVKLAVLRMADGFNSVVLHVPADEATSHLVSSDTAYGSSPGLGVRGPVIPAAL